MRSYLLQSTKWMATKWVVALAILCHSTAFAESLGEVKSPIQEERTTLFRHSSYPAAWTAAQESNRPILIYVTMPQCPHCVKMIEQTFKRPAVEEMVSGSFETVYAGRYTHARLVEKLQVKWYPTTVLVSPNNKVLNVIEGYVDASKFKRQLQTGLAAVGPSVKTR